MATTIKEISDLIEKQGWKSEEIEGHDCLRFGFATKTYVDADGDASVLLIAEVMDEGRSWRVFAPRLYKYEDGPNGLAMLKACLYATRRSKFASWHLDLADGEIQLSVRNILEETPLTETQFKRVVDHVFWAVEEFHEMIVHARDTGEINPPDKPSPLEALLRQIAALSPAGYDRVRQGLDAAITRAAEKASAPETL